MPAKRMRPCRHPGCVAVTSDKSGRCEAHRSSSWSRHQAGLSRHQRGYGTGWEKIRRLILLRDSYLCQTCRRAGVMTQAMMVDHIRPKAQGGSDDPANLESICAPCHGVKTAREHANSR